MKTLAILLLAAALAGAAYLTRPTGARAAAFLRDEDHKRSLLNRVFHPRHYAVRDRLLWVNVECDGRVAYVGAFGRFFGSSAEGSPQAPKQEN